MAVISGTSSLTAVGAGTPITLGQAAIGGLVNVVITGTFVGTVVIQVSQDGSTWTPIGTTTGYTTTLASTNLQLPRVLGFPIQVRAYCTAFTSGTITVALASLDQTYFNQPMQSGGSALILDDFGATLQGLLAIGTPETGLTAHSGGGQTSAKQVSSTTIMHVVSTVAAGNDSIKLPTVGVGGVGLGTLVIISNQAAANSAQIYGAGTDTINGVATGTGVALAAGNTGFYVCVSLATANAWIGWSCPAA
jgi:hypothetical protein